MAVNTKKKRQLYEVQAILQSAERFLGNVTIPLLKEILFTDLGFDEQFVIYEVGDRRKLTEWYNATVKAYCIRQEEQKNTSILIEVN